MLEEPYVGMVRGLDKRDRGTVSAPHFGRLACPSLLLSFALLSKVQGEREEGKTAIHHRYAHRKKKKKRLHLKPNAATFAKTSPSTLYNRLKSLFTEEAFTRACR